jgi:hypothetical protein
MSSRHATIRAQGGTFVVEDHSSNGTFVNDKKVSRHELVDSDILKLGQTLVKFKPSSERTTMKTMAKNAFGIALVGLLVAALPGIARAQKATIKSYEFEKLTDEELKPKPDKPQRYPHLKLKVGTGAAGLKANDFQLKTMVPGGDPVAITGEKVVPFKDSEEQLDILIHGTGLGPLHGDPAPEPVPGEEAGEIKGYFEEVKQGDRRDRPRAHQEDQCRPLHLRRQGRAQGAARPRGQRHRRLAGRAGRLPQAHDQGLQDQP